MSGIQNGTREAPDEPSLRARIWLWVNALVAFGGVAVIAFVFDLGIYLHMVELDWAGFLVVGVTMVVVVPNLVLVLFSDGTREGRLSRRVPRTRTGRELAAIWAGAAALFLAGFLITAVADARTYNGHNCWTIRDDERDDVLVEILECVPGSEPEAGSGYDSRSDTGSYRFCDRLDTTSSGGTIWRCESGDY